ncbi:uncharacterized protein SRS1_16197 [Sporisorium reilianum f. sp. reilianum]|uniref:GATA-type domain-containing protein n=1 Tax=Sporisorium reilianum f. sp. reilianum TaxID=72559 RepID=A0A2N8UL86_9BASI|nr:uncharacterized protein SRS1_16197 [Sporisorium reilianum f. sp. reilianum]
MSASNPLITSPPSANLGRHPEHPFPTRPKRSNSAQFDHPGPRALFDAASRRHDLNEEPTFIPTSLGEHLLERTYLDDVVRPLVRALVKARMAYQVNGEGAAESSQAYVDLEKLRRELERSTQRARHAEQERDDLARRLDLVAAPEVASRERVAERHAEHFGPADHRGQPFPPPPAALGAKRPRPADYDRRSPAVAPGSNAVSASVAHGDGPGASIPLSNEPPHSAPVNMGARSHLPPGGPEQLSTPPLAYAHPGGALRHRAYADMHHADPHDAEPRHLARMPLTNAALEAEYGYADERADRYGMAPAQALHRAPVSRYGGMGGVRSPPANSSAYVASSSERSSMPALTTFPSTSSSSSFSAPYSSVHAYEPHDVDDMERSRKLPRMRGEPPMEYVSHSIAGGRPLSGSYAAASESSYPVRKLASTKNRTCSNCAAPHDAKFRRGPNGPGTLCDRCGSRWKKYKEQESSRRDSQPSNEAVAAAAAAAQTRVSSASASSHSPMEAVGEEANGVRREGEPREGAVEGAQRERERSASVDQLIDE